MVSFIDWLFRKDQNPDSIYATIKESMYHYGKNTQEQESGGFVILTSNIIPANLKSLLSRKSKFKNFYYGDYSKRPERYKIIPTNHTLELKIRDHFLDIKRFKAKKSWDLPIPHIMRLATEYWADEMCVMRKFTLIPFCNALRNRDNVVGEANVRQDVSLLFGINDLANIIASAYNVLNPRLLDVDEEYVLLEEQGFPIMYAKQDKGLCTITLDHDHKPRVTMYTKNDSSEFKYDLNLSDSIQLYTRKPYPRVATDTEEQSRIRLIGRNVRVLAHGRKDKGEVIRQEIASSNQLRHLVKFKTILNSKGKKWLTNHRRAT